jgi:hypothetical protein
MKKFLPKIGELIRMGVIEPPSETNNLLHIVSGGWAAQYQDFEELDEIDLAKFLEYGPTEPREERDQRDIDALNLRESRQRRK